MSALPSVEAIRECFPALRRVHAGSPVAYFDGPGGTQVPERVAAAVAEYLLHHNANTHWGFPTSDETDRVIAEGRSAAADLLGGSEREIVFGQNMTTLAFRFARALGRDISAGSEIVVTQLEHRANVDPWLDMAAENGLTVRTVPFDPATGTLDPELFATYVGARTRLIAIGGASNALGTVNDLGRIAELARSVGSLMFVDAVHSTPHIPVDVEEIGCDALACSPYKFYGPHAGILWARRELLESLQVSKLLPASDAAPERLETGTLGHEAIAGTTAAIDFLADLSQEAGSRRERLRRAMAGLHERGNALVRRMWEGLSAIDGVRLYGPAPGEAARTPTVSFTVAGVSSRDVSRHLSGHCGVFCSHGNFYASDVTDRLGVSTDGLVRAGAACYTTEAEVDRLLLGVAETVR